MADPEPAEEVSLDGPAEGAEGVELTEEQPAEPEMTKEEKEAIAEEERKRAILDDETLRQDYMIEFRRDGEMVGEIAVENSKFKKWHSLTEHAKTHKDPETGEPIHYLFALITTKDESGDMKLASILDDINAADVNTHTYDARSGADMRITNIGCTESRLVGFADAMDYQRPLDPEKTEAACLEKGLVLENTEDWGAEKWYPPYSKLTAPFESPKEDLYKPLTDGDRMKLMRLIISGDKNYKGMGRGCGLDIDELESTKEDNAFCLACFPLHDTASRDELENKWMPLDWPWNLPVGKIKEYYGEEIGFYFAFLGHLASSMMPLVPFVFAMQIWSFVEMVEAPKVLYANSLMAVGNIMAFGVILDYWKFHESHLAHKWGTFGTDRNVPARPGFEGTILKDPITGKLVIEFPQKWRAPRARLTAVTSLSLLVMLVLTVTMIFVYKAALKRQGAGTMMSLLPSILNAVQVAVYGALYKALAEKLTDFENHRTVLEHNSELFKKLTTFYAVNNYAALLYIAFIKGPAEGCYDAISGSSVCGIELGVQVAIVFVTNDFVSRVQRSVIVPRVRRFIKTYLAAGNEDIVAEAMGPAEKEFALLQRYDPTKELVMDYIELYVQWGYLTLFSSAFPFTILFAMITNGIETRTDGYKLLHEYRRVLPNRVSGVGEPLTIFKNTLFFAVPINAALVVYTYGGASFVRGSYHVWVFIFLIAAMYFLLSQIGSAFPKVPTRTMVQIKRQEIVYNIVIQEQEADDDMVLTLSPDMVGKTMAELKQAARDADAALSKPEISTRVISENYNDKAERKRRASVKLETGTAI